MTDENTQIILSRLEEKFSTLEAEIKDIRMNQEVFFKLSDGYQKAADRVANLAFTVVGAAAAIAVISPAVRALAEFAAR